MKKVISLALSIFVFLISSFSVFAVDVDHKSCGKTIVTIGDWVYEAINGGSYWELDEYIGSGGDVIVPRIVNDKMVVSIGSHCFLNNTTVKNVETSSPLWTVSDYAFLNCTSLESFECNFALKEIGVGAFSGTSSLKRINLEDSVVSVISPHAFMSSGIEQVELPETCTKIMHDAFSQCNNLEEIVIPRSVETIENNAFSSSSKLKISCYKNSAAHNYAINNGIDFRLLDEPLVGDANADGKISISDATAVQKYKAGLITLSKYGMVCADTNHDGQVTVRDATLIQMRIANIINEF